MERTARKLRVQYPGAIYHVMSRADRREAIFRDDLDGAFSSRRWKHCRSSASDQFPDRLAVVHDVARAALMIQIGGVERYAHVVINGRGNIARGHRPLLDCAAVAFGRANDLPT